MAALSCVSKCDDVIVDEGESQLASQFCLAEMFEKPFSETALPKDLPRLASRISVRSDDVEHEAIALSRPSVVAVGSAATGPAETVSTAETPAGPSAVAQVLNVLASIFLGSEGQAETRNACDVYDAAIHNGDDPQPACLELLTNLGGDASILVRALKLVNQGVILYGLAKLRETVKTPDGPLLTRDVRGPDGWLIHIEFFNESFRIRHVRKEQSVEMPGFGDPSDHFEFSFEVAATLDAGLERVCATWLRIIDVEYAPSMSPHRRDELMAVLGMGKLLVAAGSSRRFTTSSDSSSRLSNCEDATAAGEDTGVTSGLNNEVTEASKEASADSAMSETKDPGPGISGVQ